MCFLAILMLILAKFRKKFENPKFQNPAGSSLYAAGNDVGPIFLCSPDPGDAFCTVARLHNSFSDDSGSFEKKTSENDCKIGDDRNS